MLEILEAYLLLSGGCFLLDQVMEIYTTKRLHEDGYVYKKTDFSIFKKIAQIILSIVSSLTPVLNIEKSINFLFKREQYYQSLKENYKQMGFIELNPELIIKQEIETGIPEDFTEIPPELKEVLEEITSTMNMFGIPVIVRAGFSGTLPENPDEFLDGIPHIVVGQISFAHETEEEIPFEEMSAGEKIEFLMRQRETIIESTGYVIDENPSEKKIKKKSKDIKYKCQRALFFDKQKR